LKVRLKTENMKCINDIEGELFVSQRNTSFDSRYKFTAKELDNETNYTYFGARYYDSDISIWLSVDNLSALAPNWSPYNYVFGNPVRYVDPDGNFPDNPSGGGRRYGDRKKVKANTQKADVPSTGISYRLSGMFNKRGLHKVRVGRYSTSQWTNMPATSTNSNGTERSSVYRFTPPGGYNPDLHKIRNINATVMSNSPFQAIYLGGGPEVLNGGSGYPLIYTGCFVADQFGPPYIQGYPSSMVPLYNAVFYPVISAFAFLLPNPTSTIPASIIGWLANSFRINPIHGGKRDFSLTTFANPEHTHNLSVRYRTWVPMGGNNPTPFLRRPGRLLLYGRSRK